MGGLSCRGSIALAPIRSAHVANAVDTPFDPASEVVLYTHSHTAKRDDTTGELLAEMGAWAYGLPSATALPDGDLLVIYYAGDDGVGSPLKRLRLA